MVLACSMPFWKALLISSFLYISVSLRSSPLRWSSTVTIRPGSDSDDDGRGRERERGGGGVSVVILQRRE